MPAPTRRRTGHKPGFAPTARIPRALYGWILAGVIGGAVAALAQNWDWFSPSSPGRQITVYRNHGCPCYAPWVRHLEEEGFAVRVFEVARLEAARVRAGNVAQKPGCHFAIAGGYFVEGHVTANDIKRLIVERPEARGIAIVGNPRGLPGLKPVTPPDPYEVWVYREDGHAERWARHDGA